MIEEKYSNINLNKPEEFEAQVGDTIKFRCDKTNEIIRGTIFYISTFDVPSYITFRRRSYEKYTFIILCEDLTKIYTTNLTKENCKYSKVVLIEKKRYEKSI